ncbi:MAG: hypothetical protein ACK46G_01210 [Flavobacteriales bacterium]|jgi:hypothetical protein
MPLIREFGIPVLHWGRRSLEKYWPIISKQVIDRFGRGPFIKAPEVKEVLNFCFEWTLGEFRRLTVQQHNLGFYKTVAGLYENTIEVQGFLSMNEPLSYIKEQDFVTNRNGLRLILERACELDLTGTGEVADITDEQAQVIEDLLYLTTWIWGFAQAIAHQQLLGEVDELHIDSDDTMRINRKRHYDDFIRSLRQEMIRVGQEAIHDIEGVGELTRAFKQCMGIDLHQDAGFVPEPEGIHPYAEYPLLVDVPYDEIIQRLANTSKVEIEKVRIFCAGWTLSRDTMPGLEKVIRKPGGQARHMYRPILVWNVDGQRRAICAPQRWSESLTLMAVNALQWREVPPEWLANDKFKDFVNRKHDAHDKILEDRVELILKAIFPHYHRNPRLLQLQSGKHLRFDVAGLGEVDFLFLSHKERKLYVVDCKYHRPRHDMIGYRMDQSNFESDYEPKLEKKIQWFEGKLSEVAVHFSLRHNGESINLEGYSVEGIFVVNTLTMYCYKGRFRAQSILQFEEWARDHN